MDPGQEKLPGPGTEAVNLTSGFDGFQAPWKAAVMPSVEHLEMLQRANDPTHPVSWMAMQGAHGLYLFRHDPVETLMESLFLLRKSTWNKDWSMIPFFEKPLGWDPRTPIEPTVVLTRAVMEVDASQGLGVRIKVEETLRANGGKVQAALLELYSRKWEFNRGGPTERPVRLLKATGADGKELAFDHRDDEVVLMFPTPLDRGQEVKVTFEIEGDLLIHPRGDNYWQLGVEPWFPMPKAYSGQDYTVEATIRVPKPYTPLASGTTVSRTSKDNRNELKVRIDKPVQFFIIQAGHYALKEATKDGLTVRIATYADSASDPERLLRLSQQIITYYQSFLGPFPFPEFTVIQQNEWGYGQAPPGIMFITNEAFKKTNDDLLVENEFGETFAIAGAGKAYAQGVNSRFAHEIAHQYWGHVVKMPSPEEQWLTESFSEMCAGLAVRQMKKQGPSYFAGKVNTWKNRAQEATGTSSIAYANRLRTDPGYQSSLDRQGLIYDKGAYLLDYIRRDIGDNAFMAFLRNYQAIFSGKFGTTQHVVGLLKHMTKRDYSDLFERCYWGTEMPPEKP